MKTALISLVRFLIGAAIEKIVEEIAAKRAAEAKRSASTPEVRS